MDNVDFLRNQIIEKNKKDLTNNSREKLMREVIKRITTTMIGSLSCFEQQFGHLWGHGKDESLLSAEESAVLKIWTEIRKTILDNGNKQVRQLTEDIKEYTIQWKGSSNG